MDGPREGEDDSYPACPTTTNTDTSCGTAVIIQSLSAVDSATSKEEDVELQLQLSLEEDEDERSAVSSSSSWSIEPLNFETTMGPHDLDCIPTTTTPGCTAVTVPTCNISRLFCGLQLHSTLPADDDSYCDHDYWYAGASLDDSFIITNWKDSTQSLQHDLTSGNDKETVAPLPRFFATRFRTMDAEKRALKNNSVDVTTAAATTSIALDPTSHIASHEDCDDWYQDMFSFWNMSSATKSQATPLWKPISCSPVCSSPQSQWNGHLPLGPDQPSLTCKNRRVLRRHCKLGQLPQQGRQSKSQPVQQNAKVKAKPPIQLEHVSCPMFPSCHDTMDMNINTNIDANANMMSVLQTTPPNPPVHDKTFLHATPYSVQQQRHKHRPLPVIPVKRSGHHHDDWEMVFLANSFCDNSNPNCQEQTGIDVVDDDNMTDVDLNESQSPSNDDSKGKRTSSRTAATTSVAQSTSIPAGVSPAKKHEAKHGKSKATATAATGNQMDFDTIAVRTPGADRSALKELPALRDAPPTKREELFILKLKLCSVIFSFDDPTADKRGKDMKRQTLLELVDYVNTPAGQKIFTESVMSDLMAMVSANVCRALPPATDDFDPEEDEPVLEPAWPHLQVAYEFFLRFIVSSEVNAKAAKKYVDQKFCLQLVELFDSEDPRERDYLKTILHRIYGKFMSHRSFIRRAISNVFYRFVYETERHNGIGELLEILGSIINGFAIPLKKEHLQFLVRALIPLHKPKCVALYHQQLSYCIIQYVEKDADTATPILNGFFKCWPWSSSAKQVMFLNELEEILELLGADQLAQVSTMLFTNLARCLDSDHFQVVERALFLWNNEHLVNSGCLSRLNAQTVLPIIYRPLYKNSAGHWNATVEGLAQNVLKMYMEYDLVLYDKCAKAYYREEEEAKRKLEALEAQWHAVEASAAQNMPALMAK